MDYVPLFPAELTDLIFSYLSLADLLRCSLCSKTWRKAVNSDKLWYQFCIKNEFTNRRDKTPCQSLRNAFYVKVSGSKPDLQIPVNTSLDPLCDWRMYFAENMLMRERWRSGKCVLRDIPHSEFATRDLTKCMACDGELLAVGDESGRVILWNITCAPVPVVHIYHSKPDDAALTDVHLHQKHLLIERGQVLRVHRITNLSETTEIYELNMESYLGYNDPEMTGMFYLAFHDDTMALSGCLSNHVHIIRVSTGERIQSFTLPESLLCIGQSLFFDKDLYVPAFRDIGEKVEGYIFVRNIKERSWKQVAQCSELPLDVFVNEKLIVLRDRHYNFFIWNRKDGKRVSFGPWETSSSDDTLVLHGTKLIHLVHALCKRKIYVTDSARDERLQISDICGPWHYKQMNRPKWACNIQAIAMLLFPRNLLALWKPECEYDYYDHLAMGRDSFLVSDLNNRILHIWDIDTGAFVYGVDIFSEKTPPILYMWNDGSKIIAIPRECKFKNSIVLIDFRFNSS